MTLPPEPDPDHVAAVVLGCSLVAGLHGGRFGEAATYLPRRRVVGVRVTPTELGVHVTGRYPASISEIDQQLRAALAPYQAGLTLTITIEDYAAPDTRPHTDAPMAAQPGAAHPKEKS